MGLPAGEAGVSRLVRREEEKLHRLAANGPYLTGPACAGPAGAQRPDQATNVARRFHSPCARRSILTAGAQWATAIDNSSASRSSTAFDSLFGSVSAGLFDKVGARTVDEVTDVTERLAHAWPDFLPDWRGARLYLVCSQARGGTAWCGPQASRRRGGLAAGTLRRIGDYIEEQLSQPISLHDLASVAELSDCHFARAFKQSVGMPPHRYLMHRRVQRAVALIQATDRPLSQIALDTGFCDQSHFSRLFARATGQTPRGLRRAVSVPADGRGLAGIEG
jgi:AraC-like DNA-binding protein